MRPSTIFSSILEIVYKRLKQSALYVTSNTCVTIHSSSNKPMSTSLTFLHRLQSKGEEERNGSWLRRQPKLRSKYRVLAKTYDRDIERRYRCLNAKGLESELSS
ncbi:hypothetical protein PoB_003763200 [Plakobranchus ocellatus]|uniref:Uncharacterized protein n=1 Tax=Plakobranchus ocellatus TaxID=259542 RepID=A0AAV4AVT6_9GAST|nr:hypothetical protein PoB_003763200 [Plakobranchus ocellatus]